MSKINLKNVQAAIDIMRRVDEQGGKGFNLCHFQDTRHGGGEGWVFDEQEAHACGTTACFSGWVNLSPEWRSQPNIKTKVVAAMYEGMGESSSMAKWLGISIREASGMIFNGEDDEGNEIYKGKSYPQVTVCDVINHLEKIKERGLKQNEQN
jgi:hypothetical protein